MPQIPISLSMSNCECCHEYSLITDQLLEVISRLNKLVQKQHKCKSVFKVENDIANISLQALDEELGNVLDNDDECATPKCKSPPSDYEIEDDSDETTDSPKSEKVDADEPVEPMTLKSAEPKSPADTIMRTASPTPVRRKRSPQLIEQRKDSPNKKALPNSSKDEVLALQNELDGLSLTN